MSPSPFVRETSQYDPKTGHHYLTTEQPVCQCEACQAYLALRYGHEERPGANIPIRTYIIGLALSAVIALIGLAVLWSRPAHAREGTIHPVAAPASLTKARAACPTDSVPCLHGKLRRAYESIAWQRSARQHAQATTVQDITRDAIAWAAAKYHVSAADMTSVGICESHLWPFATNGQYAGAWQLSARHRSDPIFDQVPWQDAYAEASHVARYVKAHGWGEWQCRPGGGLRW